MANNPILYDAVIAAAAGGIEAGRWLTNSNVGSYDNVRLAAIHVADVVDALIAPNPNLIQADAFLLESIVRASLLGRVITATTNVSSLAVAMVALWTNARAALLQTEPLVIERIGWDGSANFTQIVLAAPHTPGLYLVTGIIDVTTAVAGGVITRHASWTNEDGVVETADNTLVSMNASISGVQPQGDSLVTLVSNGLGDITIEWQPGGVPAGAVIDVFSVAQLVGRRS